MGELGLLLLLGLIQGLTEFLPISSSGHLVLAGAYLPGGDQLQHDATLEVMLHVGTLIAVLAYYRADIFGLARGVFGGGVDPLAQRRLCLWLVLASIPAGIVGVGFEEQIGAFFGAPTFAAGMLLVTAAVLAASVLVRGPGRGLDGLGARAALLIGCAQAIAILPGISRSGATIVAGLALGLSMPAAATFSFLLSIPATGGAILLKSAGVGEQIVARPGPALVGVTASALVGFASLGFLAWLGRARRLWWFAPYCAAVGIAGLIAGFSAS